MSMFVFSLSLKKFLLRKPNSPPAKQINPALLFVKSLMVTYGFSKSEFIK